MGKSVVVTGSLKIPLAKAITSLPGTMRHMAQEGAELLRDNIKMFTPNAHIKEEIRVGRVNKVGILRKYVVEVVGHHSATSYMEYGTRPHFIFPHDPYGALSFHWKFHGGKKVYFKHVLHPGQIPVAMFQAGAAKTEAEIGRKLGMRLDIWRTASGL